MSRDELTDQERVAVEVAAANREPRTPPARRYPDGLPGIGMLGEEANVLRGVLPRRNRWPALAKFREDVAAIEAHIRELSAQSQRVHDRLISADRDDADRHAAWLLDGQQGDDPPTPQKPELEAERDRLAAEIAGGQAAVEELNNRQVDYVERHRPKLRKDLQAPIAEAQARLEQKLRETEEARDELVALRETAIWLELYPDCHESDIQISGAPVAGGQRRRLAPHGLELAVPPHKLFAVLREDASWLPEAIPPHSQLARDRLRNDKPPATGVWDRTDEGQQWHRDERQQRLRERMWPS